MNGMTLLAIGGFVILIIIGAVAAWGVKYSKVKRRSQIGPGFDGDDHEEEKPGTAV